MANSYQDWNSEESKEQRRQAKRERLGATEQERKRLEKEGQKGLFEPKEGGCQ